MFVTTLSLVSRRAGAALVLVNTKMELRKINHCIALARPSVWVWAKGSWFKWLHVSWWMGHAPRSPTHLQCCATVLHCSQNCCHIWQFCSV